MIENQLQIDALTLGPGTPFAILALDVLDAPAVRASDFEIPGHHGWGFAEFDTYAGLILNCKVLILKDDPDIWSSSKGKVDARANLNNLRKSLSLFGSSQDKTVTMFLCGESQSTQVVGRVRKVSVDDSTMQKAWAVVDWMMVCELPYRESSTEHTVNIPLPVGSGGRTYNRTYNMIYGSSGTPGVVSVNNVGNAPVFPTFKINGGANGVTDPSIINVNKNRTLKFVGLTIPAGSYVIIDTRNATADLDGTASRLDKLVVAEWFELDPGLTDIQYTANTVLTGSSVDVFWRDGYV